ncbi:hypothetical protein Dimus_024403, partial [Dionaea muscipula]
YGGWAGGFWRSVGDEDDDAVDVGGGLGGGGLCRWLVAVVAVSGWMWVVAEVVGLGGFRWMEMMMLLSVIAVEAVGVSGGGEPVVVCMDDGEICVCVNGG